MDPDGRPVPRRRRERGLPGVGGCRNVDQPVQLEERGAGRFVLDLRDRLGGEGDLVAEGPLTDVRDALLSLGLTPPEASEVLVGIEADGRPVEDLLREALQKVGR